MSDVMILVIAAGLVFGFLVMFYAFTKAGIRNYPYDRPGPSPWNNDPFEGTTPSYSVGSPGEFPASHRTPDQLDLDDGPNRISRPARSNGNLSPGDKTAPDGTDAGARHA